MKVLRLIAVCAATSIFAAPAHAGVPTVDARAFYVLDAATGDVLVQHASSARLPVASITKLMTVLVTLQHARLDDVVTVRGDAAKVGESTINLRSGDRISVRDLIKGALIQSANDAADALADFVGHGSEPAFVAMMNAQVRRIGLTGTHFTRADGLDAPGNVSTAHDVTVLAQELMKRPVVRAIVRERIDRIAGNRVLHTWNDLLGEFRGLVGVKTGHTAAAGWCQVAEVRRDGLDVYATILGSPTRGQRNADLAALLRWAFSVERPAWVIAPGRVYVNVAVGYGRHDVPLVAETPVARPVRIDRPFVEHVLAPTAVSLPVRRGQKLGEVRVFSGRRLVAQEPLVAARSVSRPDLAGRLGFYTSRTFAHIGGWLS